MNQEDEKVASGLQQPRQKKYRLPGNKITLSVEWHSSPFGLGLIVNYKAWECLLLLPFMLFRLNWRY